MPFELRGREPVEGGIRLLLRCAKCGGEASLTVRDNDPLEGSYPVACPCGEEVNMFFGSPKVGKLLLKALKEEPDPGDELMGRFTRFQN